MAEYLFKRVGDQFIPLLPGSGSADGNEILTAEQYAAEAKKTVESCHEAWLAFWPDSVRPSEPEAIAAAGLIDPPPVPVEVVARVAESARMLLLRDVRFPHIKSDKHWQFVVQHCLKLKIDPSAVWVKLETNYETGEQEPIIITTLLAMQTIAARNPEYDRVSLPSYCDDQGNWSDVWVSDKPPVAARAHVFRRGGLPPIEGMAYFDRCAQYVKEGDRYVLAKFWRGKSAGPQLGKCGQVAAIRAANANLIGNLLSKDEYDPDAATGSMPGAVASGTTVVDKAAEPDVPAEEVVTFTPPPPPLVEPSGDPKQAWSLVDESTPASVDSLKLALLRIDEIDSRSADNAVERYKLKWPTLFVNHLQAFCALVLKVVRDNPGAFAVA